MDEGAMSASAPTVLIVDDHAGFRHSATVLLSSGGLEVVGTASDGGAALELAEELEPAVVLLDVRLPDMTGFDVADGLARLPAPPAVVLTSSLDASEVEPRADPRTVRAFIPKSSLSAQRLREVLGLSR